MRRLCITALLWLLASGPAWTAPRVVVTIAPIHSLVAGVMAGAGAPRLLLPAGASPHSYALLPSDARLLAQAELVVWVGPELELFLRKPLATLAADTPTLELMQLPGLTLLASGGAEHEHAHDAGHGAHDAHIWLDIDNARRIVHAVAERLAALDPAQAATYRANAAAIDRRLEALDHELAAALAPVRARAFLAFHDAYRYFQRRYGLRSAGALALSPEQPPGARTVADARARIRQEDVRCVFREPQFEPSLADAIVRGTDAEVAVLDPLGADLTPGPEAYFELLRRMSAALTGCLGR